MSDAPHPLLTLLAIVAAPVVLVGGVALYELKTGALSGSSATSRTKQDLYEEKMEMRKHREWLRQVANENGGNLPWISPKRIRSKKRISVPKKVRGRSSRP